MPIVTLLTDFGIADSYVAELKGVLLSRVPEVTIVDISHQVPAGDVRAAQYLLGRAWTQFPRATVHLAVVDPGVGTERRALAADANGHRFLAPDNGILSFLPEDARVFALPVPPGASATFHGRDLFAPAAASLASGDPIDVLGTPLSRPMRLSLPTPRNDGGTVVGEIIYVDHFGTLISNIPTSSVSSVARVRIAAVDIGPVRRTFADVARGELVAFGGSGGSIEIAVRDGSAALKLSTGVWAVVTVGEATVKDGK